MDKRNAFERQIADEIEYEVGPPRNLDALAIARQAKTTSPRWRFSSMSSTIKFATATAVLATAGVAFFLVAPPGPTPDDGVVAPPGAEQPSASPLQSPVLPAVEEPTDAATETTPQDEGADPLAPATFAWTGIEDTDQGFLVEAVDPRASGEMILGEGPAIRTDANFVVTVESRLVNDGGAWVGMGREIGGLTYDPTGGDWQAGEFDTEWEVGITMWEMTGEGDYDGLSLILFTEADFDENLFAPHPISWGLIFPTDSASE